MDWSLADPELLLSCGKDNRILCWNPNTAEVNASNFGFRFILTVPYLEADSKL
jgi:hypothetical protein